MTEPVLQRLVRDLGVSNNDEQGTHKNPSNLGESSSNKKDQNDVVAGFSGSNADISRQQSVVGGDQIQTIIASIMAAQEQQFNNLQTLVMSEINTTNKRLDSFISDLVIEDEAPQAKKQKTNNEQTKEVETSVAQKADNAANGSASKEVGQPQEAAAQNATSYLSRLTDKFHTTEKTGSAISEGLANLLKSLIRERACSKKDDERKRNLESNLRPENCEVLTPPSVNKEIWSNISSSMRSADLEYQKLQKILLRAIGPIMNVVDHLLKTDPEGKDKTMSFMIDNLMEATSMMAFANDDINNLRKNNIKSELNHDYRSLCSNQTPVTEFLFGDNVSEQVKTIQDTNKVSKKVSNAGSSDSFLGSRPSWTSGSRRGRGWGKFRYNPQRQYNNHNNQGANKSQSGFRRNKRKQ